MLTGTRLRARRLRKAWDNDPEGTAQHVIEMATKKEYSLEDYSIRDLAEELIPDGREYVRLMDPKHRTGVLEAAHAVDTAAFSHITGQLIFSTMMAITSPAGCQAIRG